MLNITPGSSLGTSQGAFSLNPGNNPVDEQTAKGVLRNFLERELQKKSL